MRTGQPIKAGAINVKLFENGDAPGPGREQRGLGRDHVVVGEAAAREAFANERHRAFSLGEGLVGDTLRFHRPGGEEHLKPRDLAFAILPKRGHVGLGRDAFEPGLFDGPLIAVKTTEWNGPADHQAEVLALPEMPDADTDGGVGRGTRLFDPDPGQGHIALRGQHGKVDHGSGAGGLARGAGVFEIGRIERKGRSTDPETTQGGLGQSGLDTGLIEIDLGLRQLGLGPGTREQGVTRHVHAALHLRLKLFCQRQSFPSDLQLGPGGEGVDPGALNLLQSVQPPNGGFGLDHGGLAARQGHPRRSITAPFEPLLIGQGRLGPVDEAATAEGRQVFNRQAQARVWANVRLTHGCVAGASPRFTSGQTRVNVGGSRERVSQRQGGRDLSAARRLLRQGSG